MFYENLSGIAKLAKEATTNLEARKELASQLAGKNVEIIWENDSMFSAWGKIEGHPEVTKENFHWVRNHVTPSSSTLLDKGKFRFDENGKLPKSANTKKVTSWGEFHTTIGKNNF